MVLEAATVRHEWLVEMILASHPGVLSPSWVDHSLVYFSCVSNNAKITSSREMIGRIEQWTSRASHGLRIWPRRFIETVRTVDEYLIPKEPKEVLHVYGEMCFPSGQKIWQINSLTNVIYLTTACFPNFRLLKEFKTQIPLCRYFEIVLVWSRPRVGHTILS